MAPDSQTALAVLACIVVAGLIGGFINYLGQSKPADGNGNIAGGNGPNDPKSPGPAGNPSARAVLLPATYYVLLSVAAAITVPVLLYLIQSKISDSLFKPLSEADLQTWFVFFGLCVLAAVFAQKYLEAVYAKLLQEINQTRNAANKALGRAGEAEENSIKAKGVVDDLRLNELLKPGTKGSLAESLAPPAPPPMAPTNLSDTQKRIFEALNDPSYPLKRRTLGGIMNDAALDQRTALSNIEQLKTANLVKEETGGTTGTIYFRWIG